jgi:hypothetical protein
VGNTVFGILPATRFHCGSTPEQPRTGRPFGGFQKLEVVPRAGRRRVSVRTGRQRRFGSLPQQASISKNISTEVKPTINSTLALCGMMEWYLTPTDKDDLFKFFYGPELLTWISVPGQVL